MLTVSENGLLSIVTNALERMAFVFAEQSEAQVGEVLDRACSHARIELRGGKNFRITVSGTPGLLDEIAASMMGVDESAVDWRETGYETVAEMSNVFGGELVQELSRQGHSLLIGLPSEIDPAEARSFGEEAARAGTVCVVGSESGEMVVAVVGD